MIFTDALQTVIMVVGATALAIMSKNKLLMKFLSWVFPIYVAVKKKLNEWILFLQALLKLVEFQR